MLDNLQLTLTNVHVRIENQDADNNENTFSLGVTLDQIVFHTTDAQGNKQYVDRTTPENSDLPLHKILNISKFAVYYKTDEAKFLGGLGG